MREKAGIRISVKNRCFCFFSIDFSCNLLCFPCGRTAGLHPTWRGRGLSRGRDPICCWRRSVVDNKVDDLSHWFVVNLWPEYFRRNENRPKPSACALRTTGGTGHQPDQKPLLTTTDNSIAISATGHDFQFTAFIVRFVSGRRRFFFLRKSFFLAVGSACDQSALLIQLPHQQQAGPTNSLTSAAKVTRAGRNQKWPRSIRLASAHHRNHDLQVAITLTAPHFYTGCPEVRTDHRVRQPAQCLKVKVNSMSPIIRWLYFSTQVSIACGSPAGGNVKWLIVTETYQGWFPVAALRSPCVSYFFPFWERNLFLFQFYKWTSKNFLNPVIPLNWYIM